MGRETGKGMSLRKYAKGLQRVFGSKILKSEMIKAVVAKEFVNTIAEDGFTYIVLSSSHTFVIEQAYKGKWKVKGNFDDLKSEIIMYVKIENNYGK